MEVVSSIKGEEIPFRLYTPFKGHTVAYAKIIYFGKRRYTIKHWIIYSVYKRIIIVLFSHKIGI